jgi:dihydroflavonol-4-reductase
MQFHHNRGMGMRVFLTGATGLLGSHLLEQGLRRGFQFSVLARDVSPRSFLSTVQNQTKQLEVIRADLLNLDPTLLPKEIDVVVHCAGLASSRLEDQKQMRDLNVVATQNLYNLLSDRGAQWIQISSVSTMCDGNNTVVTEDLQGHCRDTGYAKSKLEIDNWLESKRSNILFAHPCYMLGPWDSKPSSGIIFHALKMKKHFKFHDGIKNFIHAADVATGIYQALGKGCQGHYLLGHHNVRIQEFLEKVAKELRISNPAQTDKLEALEPYAREFCLSAAVSCEKAKQDFGFAPIVSLEQTLTETMDYFSKMKMLRRSSMT